MPSKAQFIIYVEGFFHLYIDLNGLLLIIIVE